MAGADAAAAHKAIWGLIEQGGKSVALLQARLKTGGNKRLLDKVSSGEQRRIPRKISLADFAGELLHVGLELIAEF